MMNQNLLAKGETYSIPLNGIYYYTELDIFDLFSDARLQLI